MVNETEEYKKLIKAIKEASDTSTRRYELEKAQAEEIKKLYESRAEAERDLAEVISQNNRIIELEARRTESQLRENLDMIAELQAKEAEQTKKYMDAQRQAAAYGKANRVEEGRQQKAKAKEALANIQLLRKELNERKARRAQDLKDADSAASAADANKGLQSSLRSVLKTTTGLTGEVGGLTGALIKFGNIEDPAQQEAILNNLKMTVKETFNPLAIADNLLNKIGQSTLKFMMEFDKLAASFRKNTGIIDRGFTGIEQRIVNVQRANLRMGVSMDEAFQAANSLTAEMASFTSMTDDAQATVLQATTVLQEFGVGAQTTAQIFNNFSKGLGYNADQLERLSTQLMGISTSLKIPPQIIATEFNAASKELMKYGDDMVDVFKGIAEQSKQTGIAMGELLGIVKQFDTFEGAGAAVGKLNAILGGPYLNAINMLYATEEERIKQLRQSIQLSGRQFSDLSRFEQQAIATAAGISDMTVAARLFGGTNSEFAKTQMSMKEMQERAAAAQSVQEKFTQVMQSFAIALGPLVNILGVLAEALMIILTPFNFLEEAGIKNASMLNNLVVAGIAFAAMAKTSLIPSITTVGGAMKVAMGPIAAFGVAFGAVLALKKYMGPFTKAALALAAGIALVWAALAGPAAIGMAGSFAVAAGAIGAATALAMPSYSEGKRPGEKVPGGAGLVGEKGAEMVVTEDGSRYMVNSPSVMALDKNDTVYTNAETKAMLNGGGGSRDNSAELAVIRQQQQDAAQDRALIQQTLDAVMTVASRPIELDGKKVFEGTKPQLNRALGLSRRGSIA